jgi:hypothetical protein
LTIVVLSYILDTNLCLARRPGMGSELRINMPVDFYLPEGHSGCGEARAALITKVCDPRKGLCYVRVFCPPDEVGYQPTEPVRYSAGGEPGTFCLPGEADIESAPRSRKKEKAPKPTAPAGAPGEGGESLKPGEGEGDDA